MEITTEVEALMNALLPLMQESLQTGDRVAPVAGGVDQNGQLHRVLPPATADQPLATIEGLVEQLRLGVAARSFQATGILSVVDVHSPQEDGSITAVRAALEREDGFAIDIFFPIDRTEGQVRFRQPFAGKGERVVFAAV